ncbi:MAG: hypothetical protein FWH21_08325, partial [Kiritimatiellaeota bacterium]|nr:hypothetical protein [Kiritimatiellota bacterium]
SERVWRAYAGFGSVVENPGAFALAAGGFALSTRHVGADYPNGLSLVQATDVFPDQAVHIPETRRFGPETPHDATFTLVPSARGAYDAARAFRDISGYRRGPGMDAVLGRMCIDQWGGDFRAAAKGLAEAGRYGLHDAVFVKHDWQRWGYDYRLPEIYPPRGGLDAFLEMRDAAKAAGMLFCPHDNYIDFYPDAAGFSYDRTCFDERGAPVRAWYNQGTRAQSYRWLPHAFGPVMQENMRLMRDGFRPDSLFIDVFTAITPFDYHDRNGTFHTRTRTLTEWAAAFDTCRAILKRGSPMISEGGHDGLIGSVDAAQSDHFMPSRVFGTFGRGERTPWQDMVTHGKMALFAGGLGPRYSATNWDDHAGSARHGYGSDDYLSNTVMGGRNPMCDGPFSRRTVMTYWLQHEACKALAAMTLEAHRFGDTIHQQHTTFSNGDVWANRGSNLTWRVADNMDLPEYGFYVKTPKVTAGIVLLDGQRAAFSKSRDAFFADARPVHNPSGRDRMESAVTAGRHTGGRDFEVAIHYNVLEPLRNYRPFVHICSDAAGQGNDRIAFQPPVPMDLSQLERPGAFDITLPIRIPPEMPDGVYTIRYGFYDPTDGHRLAISGLLDGTMRVEGGELHLAANADGTAQGRYVSEDRRIADGLNVDGKMLDFGGIVTDGAFRLVNDARKTWRVIPLPGSRAFRADIALDVFGSGRRKVKAVEMLDPLPNAKVEWAQDARTLKLTCDARAFAYKIVFE